MNQLYHNPRFFGRIGRQRLSCPQFWACLTIRLLGAKIFFMKSVKLLFALLLFLGLSLQCGPEFKRIQNSEIQDTFVLSALQALPCVFPEIRQDLKQEASSLISKNFFALPFKANTIKYKKNLRFVFFIPLQLSEKKLSRYIKSVIAIQSLP